MNENREIHDLAARLARSPSVILFLDYDGTLVPFASTPDLAAPDAELIDLLAALGARPGIELHLVSGRDRDTLERWLGTLPLALHAEHGFWSRERGGSWKALSHVPQDWKARARPILEDFARRTAGAFVEEKSVALAWHYRRADAELGALRARELCNDISIAFGETHLQALAGNHVVEVRLRDANKGVVVRRLADRQSESCTIVAIGDDTTDEDMFAALPSGGVAVHVGPSPSQAAYRMNAPADVRRFLGALAAR